MTWNDAVTAFENNISGFHERQSQTDLAHAVEKAFETGTPLLGQAPPGTGKSYISIITLRDRARATGQPCVASTATKALQDQYISDCRKIRDVYDPSLKYMILKGRGNYLCRAQMAKADEVLLGLPKSIDELIQLAEDDDVVGDVERLGVELTSRQRRALTTTSDECPGKSNCKFGSICFAEKAKAKAENSDVIVVSHALLAVDATLKAEGVALLPMYPAVVVDEAHELRSYVESALSTEVTQRSITQLTSDVVSFTDDRDLVATGEFASAKLFSKFDAILSRERETVLTPAMVVECQAELAAVLDHIETLEGKVSVVRVEGDEEVTRKNRLRKRCSSLLTRMRKIIIDDFASTVRWLERDRPEDPSRSRGILLKTAPLDVAPFLSEAVWAYTTPVLLSATLAIPNPKVGADFSYMAKEQGIDLVGDYATYDGPTPFDFKTQAITYIPEHMPSVRNDPEQFRVAFIDENKELIRAADGRSMLLFTSWKELNACYEAMAPFIEYELGHQVFKQGDMSSTRMLADAFAEDEHSVLFGTKSFFTGVNVEGNSLMYLGIHKNPFHYPDPLWKARCEAVDALCDDRSKWTRGSFPTLQVPDMIMTLIQGYGRLIRTLSDRGVVALFDSSLSMRNGTKYGKVTVRPALPPAPVVSDLRSAVDYLRSLHAEAVSA